jgi:hypothetical protein
MYSTNKLYFFQMLSTIQLGVLASVLLISTSCSKDKDDNVEEINEGCKKTTNESTLEKFEPEDGKCIVFIGQDMEAIGGVEGYAGG